jgi:cytochrome c biogenesis protein CcdA
MFENVAIRILVGVVIIALGFMVLKFLSADKATTVVEYKAPVDRKKQVVAKLNLPKGILKRPGAPTTQNSVSFAPSAVDATMDPYGAVILVSASFATIAYRNGIHPAHFWMVVLVAFELGYLTPPVALNQLLARSVVGEAEWAEARREGTSFFSRNESVIVPCAVMAIALLGVAFIPLAFY